MFYWVILSILMAAASFGSQAFLNKFKKHKEWSVSLAAGILVSYLFLQIFPEAYSGAYVHGNIIFLGVLLGFAIFHSAEKFMYKYLKHDLIEGLEILHLGIFFIYHIIVGILLVEFLSAGLLKGFIFFFSLSFLLITSSAVFEVLHERKKRNRMIERFILGSAFIIGAVIANLYNLNSFVFFLLLSFVSGVLIYIIGREVLPKERHGNPYFFIAGVVLYAMLLIYLNLFSLI